MGPYQIKRKLGPVTYELDLLGDSRVHPVFHVALLEKAPDDIPYATGQHVINDQEDDIYEVEKVLDYQEQGRNK